jgi:hypothetical protein
MTTIEQQARRTARSAARINLSPLEWRLTLTAALATVYLAAWLAFGSILPARVVAPAGERRGARVSLAPASTVWLDDLPPGQRPAVTLPPGWRLASSGDAAPAPRVVRVPAGRAPRVRTRSS